MKNTLSTLGNDVLAQWAQMLESGFPVTWGKSSCQSCQKLVSNKLYNRLYSCQDDIHEHDPDSWMSSLCPRDGNSPL